MLVASVLGARPQFIKASMVSRALAASGIREYMIHTGQHYDDLMSDVFFRELGLRAADCNLGIGSGSHGQQTGRMISAIEPVLRDVRPDRVLVYGDTNSTLAAALAAAKLRIPVDHVEAGVRSFDRDMPEELNRILTDQLADLLLCPTQTAVANLAREGLTAGARVVGDVMLDLALECEPRAASIALPSGLREGEYFLATIHRAENTDDVERLARLMHGLETIARHIAPVLLPAHPRLQSRLEQYSHSADGVRLVPPVGYVESQALIRRARGVITDSGGIQKEALFHGIPCVTLRPTTEWVESVDARMNTLVDDDIDALIGVAADAHGRVPVAADVRHLFGDGRAASAIASAILEAGVSRRRWTKSSR